MTMNATAPAAPAAAPAAPTPAAPAERSSISSRASALKEKLSTEPTEAPAEPSTAPATGEPSAPAAAAPSAPTDDAAAKARADRLARIEQVRAKEAADAQERKAREQSKARDSEIEKLRKQLADMEPLNNVFSSEDALLAEAEKRGLSSEKIVQWMRTRLTDPNAVAQRQAQTVEEKLRAEMKALQDRLDKAEADRKAEAEKAEATRTMEQKTSSFFGQVKERASTHPLTAALHAKYGDRGLIDFANQFIAPLLPESYSLDQLHDHTEQLLDAMQIQRASAPAATPASGPSHPPQKNGAAQPATTLSNSVAAGRESLAEEVPLHQLPFSERKNRLRKKLERE